MSGTDPGVIEGTGGWASGGMANPPSGLRVIHVGGELIEITDGSHQDPLLSLSTRQAAGLVDDISAVLDIVGWPS